MPLELRRTNGQNQRRIPSTTSPTHSGTLKLPKHHISSSEIGIQMNLKYTCNKLSSVRTSKFRFRAIQHNKALHSEYESECRLEVGSELWRWSFSGKTHHHIVFRCGNENRSHYSSIRNPQLEQAPVHEGSGILSAFESILQQGPKALRRLYDRCPAGI